MDTLRIECGWRVGRYAELSDRLGAPHEAVRLAELAQDADYVARVRGGFPPRKMLLATAEQYVA